MSLKSLMDNFKSKSTKFKKRVFILFLIIIIGIIGFFIGNRWAKNNGFISIWDMITTVGSNYVTSWEAEYETVEITINENDFQKLEKQREMHLNNGIITKIKDRYVPALITYNGKKIKCKLRLKGHMTDHLQDKKWSFRIKTVGGDAFKGMRIFSFMHPGTRNYIYEWIYHQLLEKEGVATVRYSFVKIRLNKSDWGIYAVEENFGSELLSNNKRPRGPIIGFNPDLYWDARLNEHKGMKVDMNNLKIGSSYPEAYSEKENFKNSESKSDYAEAIILLEKFRRGELKTNEVFDIDKLAKFHAVLDLVGGQFSLDWSDVKYYYNPATQKIEPVGYESFSVSNTSSLSGASKFRSHPPSNSEWHDFLFSDKYFFKKYVKHLLRLSEKKYLDDFFSTHARELHNNLAILYKDFPYKKMPLDQYFINQKNIRTLLNTPIAPVIYFNGKEKDSLKFTFGCNSSLPLEIHEILIGNKKIKLVKPIFLSSKIRGEQLFFETHSFYYKNSVSKNDLKKMKFTFTYPGLKNVTEVKAKPINVLGNLDNDFIVKDANIEDFDFLSIDEERKEILIKSGSHLITSDLIIPEGYKLRGKSPLDITFENHARILSYSQVLLSGTEENPIYITSNDSLSGGIILINVKLQSNFKFVEFSNVSAKIDKSSTYKAIIYSYNSPVYISNCIFSSEADNGIFVSNSNLSLLNSSFFQIKDYAVYGEFSSVMIEGSDFSKLKKTAIGLKGTNGNINNISINGVKNGISIENASFIKGNKWKISNCQTAVEVNDYSNLYLSEIFIDNAKVGFHAEKKSDIYGASTIMVSKMNKKNVKKLKESDTKSVIKIE